MPELLRTGQGTFLFTDLEGSTRLWEEEPRAMEAALARHDAIVQEAVSACGGLIFKSVGDGFHAVFQGAGAAIQAALRAQRALSRERWPTRIPLRARMAIHTGEAVYRNGDFYGPTLNRLARVLTAGHGGQILLSDAAAEEAREGLGGVTERAALRDLGEHLLKDLDRPERVWQLLPGGEDEPPSLPLRSLEAFSHNLPRRLTSFIGRAQEAADIEQKILSNRLLTLLGPGGIGKSRLAEQVAAGLLPSFPDGVWLVELAPLTDPARVTQAVAAVLGVREDPSRPLIESLIAYLRSKRLLLLLDNCEHVVDACAALADQLLHRCPHVRVLATSREAIGVAGETPVRIPPLTLPPPPPLLEEGARPEAVLQRYEAVHLFADRAGAALPGFRIDEQNLSAALQVCRRLDGIPLAIELAAARVSGLSIKQLEERLDDRFRLLTGGSRSALPRQQTLRATIDWSYGLLNPAEQLLLRRLSVCAGGFSLEAAEAIGAGTGLAETDVLPVLLQLVNKSLVMREDQEGNARYTMLESIRQYAREALSATHEAEQVWRRHRDWFLALAEGAAPHLRGARQADWLDRLELEHDNLRVALEHCLGREAEVEAGLRLAGGLFWFWNLRGYFAEGRSWLESLLGQGGADAHPAHRARALVGLGALAWAQGDYAEASARLTNAVVLCRTSGDAGGLALALTFRGLPPLFQGDCAEARGFLEEAVRRWRALGDAWGLGLSLVFLGRALLEQGEAAVARRLHEEAVALGREAGDRWMLAMALNGLGLVNTREGAYGAAQPLFEESLQITRALGDRRFAARALNNLGEVARAQGDLARAASLYHESLRIIRELGERSGTAVLLGNLGLCALAQGDPARAAASLGESLLLSAELGEKRGVAAALVGLARVAAADERPERAAVLFGAAEALVEAIDAHLDPVDLVEYDRTIISLRAKLGADAMRAAWAEGRALPLAQAVSCGAAGTGAEPVSTRYGTPSERGAREAQRKLSA